MIRTTAKTIALASLAVAALTLQSGVAQAQSRPVGCTGPNNTLQQPASPGTTDLLVNTLCKVGAGTYNVSLNVVQDTCLQIFPGGSGQVQLSGTATTITVRIVERGITRGYNGTIAGDGTFSAVTGNGSTSSTGWYPSHDYTGSVSGRVSGNSVSGTERLNFTTGCPGQVLVINFGGAR
jgi:hypothetical protein